MFPRARGLAAALLALTAIGVSATSAAQADPVGFAPRTFISSTLAGGEPLVLADTKHGTLIYTSHEGTTHLYRNGLASIPVNWLFAYRDQVNTWYSKDNGKTWAQSQLAGTGTNATGFNARPDQNLGFSDPDLTQDSSGRVYNTGIDLANDSIFSTSDGGVTWDKGTALCHDGDRPWLASVGADNAFLSTDTEESGHEIFETTDGGNSCSTPFVDAPGAAHGIPDPGGDGKLFWNPVHKELVEPNITSAGLGVATWKRGQTAFTQQPKVYKGNIFAHWPSLGIDKAGTLYMVWDTAPTGTFLGGQGCSDSVTGDQPNTQVAPPNAIEYASSTDDGRTWSAPVVVSPPVAGHIQFWPWLAAGDAGRISIVWYRTDRAVDVDCAPVSLTIKETTVLRADRAAPSYRVVNASNSPIHYGTVCQGGTTCVATGEDRRLGDFFTNAPDANGCVMIASGDTEQGNNVTFTTAPFSLPIIIRQNSGPSLDSGVDCAHPTG